MAAQENAVDENHIVEDSAVVGHMAVGHEHIVVADARNVIFFFGTSVNSHAFAKDVVVTDDDLSLRFCQLTSWGSPPMTHPGQTRWFCPIVVVSDDDHIARQSGSITDFNIGTNDAKRPNRDPLANTA